MLVLTRKTNQSIMIGDEVEVSVLAVSRDKIRLGIAAPKDVPVFRKEVYDSIKEEQVSSDGSSPDGNSPSADSEDAVETVLDGASND
jgi:carbon storage regulator